jgi:hypothetical protein
MIFLKLRLDLAPSGEEIIINAARQGVGLPAAGGLALHRVHSRHPEPPAHTQHNYWLKRKEEEYPHLDAEGGTSVVDPDLVGAETFSRKPSGKNLSESGTEQLRIRNEFEVKLNYSEKLVKFDNFSTKCSILKYKFL